jgi:hypothetical protein
MKTKLPSNIEFNACNALSSVPGQRESLHLTLFRGLHWEEAALQLLETIPQRENFSKIDIYFTGDISLHQELDKWTYTTVPYLGVTAVLVLTTAAVLCWSTDWTESKVAFGICGAATAAMGCAAGMGLLFHFGVPFSLTSMPIPFFLMGKD